MISVIIPSWKRHEQLQLIIDELNKQANICNKNLEVILCDSKSSEKIDKLVKDNQKFLQNIKIIHKHTYNNLSAKRNLGIQLATGKYLIFLDDDCVPAQNFLKDIYTIINSIKDNTVYCGEVRFVPDLVEKSNYYRYRDSRHPRYLNNSPTVLNEWTFVAMNNMIPKDLLVKYNLLYNENFIGYGCEDHEFGMQLVNNDIEIKFSPQTIIHHEYGGNILTYSEKIKRTARDGMVNLMQQYPSLINKHKKLYLLEKAFASKGKFSAFLYKLLFPKWIVNMVNKFLMKTDHIRFLYMPFLYRYVLLASYIKGIQERDQVNRDQLKKDWYI